MQTSDQVRNRASRVTYAFHGDQIHYDEGERLSTEGKMT